MKSSPDHIDFLDIFRGVAVFAVFLFHCLNSSFGDNLPWDGIIRDYRYSDTLLFLLPFTYGKMAVALFFVISGFCIHLSFQKNHADGFKPFFIRRFWRIYPPYLMALLFFAFVLPVSRISYSGTGWLDFFVHVLSLQNFFETDFYAINPSFWSIAVEVQLYLLYPVLLVLIKRLGWTRALCLLALIEGSIRVITGITQTWSQPLPRWFTDMPLAYWFSWTLGAWLADAYINRQEPSLAKLPLWPWLILMIVSYQVKPLEPLTFLFAALTTFVIFSRLLSGSIKLPISSSFAVVHLRQAGLWSYSIYLLHQPFLMMIPWLKARYITGVAVHPLVTFAACLLLWPAVVLLANLFYRYVEVPSINFGKGFLKSASGK
ncbi:MAG TPA: acyltransferase [Verrucomicrobiae bacterium]